MIILAIENVQELIDRYQNLQAQIYKKQEELEKIKKAHIAFWEKFQRKCKETDHSLTQKEKEALSENALWDKKSVWMPIKREYVKGVTTFDLKVARMRTHGYRCSYCLKAVLGTAELAAASLCVIPELDLCKRESFEGWIGFQEDKWPRDKWFIFKKVKKEVDEYFLKAEPLEQELEALEKEKEEIKTSLKLIWDLLDNVLGYDEKRKEDERKLRESYEQTIREINRANRPPRDPDAYYWD